MRKTNRFLYRGVLLALVAVVTGGAVKDKDTRKNVLGAPLVLCSHAPETGYDREGFCRAIDEDHGTHTVCSVVTQAFLDFTKGRGNDLVTPRPEQHFVGLKAGDRWCLCALRWREALEAKVAPPVLLESTDHRTLDFVSLQSLQEHAHKP